MLAIANNIINEFRDIDQYLFTKDEVIKIIQNASATNKLTIIESDGVTLDPEKFHVTHDGVNHVMPRKEFELLYYLMSNCNKVMRKGSIMSNVWGSDVIVGERTIDVHIRKIRSRINVSNIQTIKGVGYMWKS